MNLLQRLRDHHRHVTLADGTMIYLRPLRAEDFERAEEFFGGMSEQTRYMRFMAPMPHLTDETLRTLLEAIETERACVIAAFADHGPDQPQEGIAIGRIVPTERKGTCEYALTVVDRWQGRGVGKVLLKELIDVATTLGYRRIEGSVLQINARMLAVAQTLRMKLKVDPADPGVITVSRTLLPRRPPSRTPEPFGHG